MRTTEEIKKAIYELLENDDDLLTEVCEELDNYNGYLGDDRIFDMMEINEFYATTDQIEVLYRAFYGHDAEIYTTDEHGGRHYAKFNPNRDYFYYDGYGNFVSCDEKDYSDKLDDYLIDELIEYYKQLYIDNPELEELLDEYDDAATEESEQ